MTKQAQISSERRDYNVYRNLRLFKQVDTEKEAWDAIGQMQFGDLYEVHNKDGQVRPEFIPY